MSALTYNGRIAIWLSCLVSFVSGFSLFGQPIQLQVHRLPAPQNSDYAIVWNTQPYLTYELQQSNDLATWSTVEGFPVEATLSSQHYTTTVARFGKREPVFYRVLIPRKPFAVIPAGDFEMGDSFGEGQSNELPVHTVHLDSFRIEETPVTKELWDKVYAWAIENGYSFDNAGSGEGADHPVYGVNWHNAVKWCNARSEREGLKPAYYVIRIQPGLEYRSETFGSADILVDWNVGYRLPTEAEWEKAARGGLTGKRFPWGDTVAHSQANYFANSSAFFYDISETQGYHPTFADPPCEAICVNTSPNTNPVRHFPPNGYSVHDMAGNIWEWCWDRYGSTYYSTSPGANSRGPSTGSNRIIRGGSSDLLASDLRVSVRNNTSPNNSMTPLGFRTVLPATSL